MRNTSETEVQQRIDSIWQALDSLGLSYADLQRTQAVQCIAHFYTTDRKKALNLLQNSLFLAL